MSTATNEVININVAITSSPSNSLTFTYTNSAGQPITGDVTVTQDSNIVFTLVPDTVKSGFRFVGAGFTAPFAGIIDSIAVSTDGSKLTLVDSDKKGGSAKFQLVLTNSSNNLLVLSPDPEVKNDPVP
jgi:hypothetical protein